MKISLLLLALVLTALVSGCQGHCIPCITEVKKAEGFTYYFDGQQTHCIPCSQAVSPEARLVCFGVTYTAERAK